MKPIDHPRLFARQEELDHLHNTPTLPAMVAAHRDLLQNARRWLRNTEFSGWGRGQDPSGLGKARELIDRIVTLAVACRKTGEARFRRGALDYVRMSALSHKGERAPAERPPMGVKALQLR